MLQESSPEYLHVERRFVEPLQRWGWDHLEGDTGAPNLTDRLRKPLCRTNLAEGG